MSRTPRREWSAQNRRLPERPRRVQGGLKLSKDADREHGWAGQRLLRLMEQASSPADASEGLEYATAGQTRQLDIEPGEARGLVQGRMPRSYRVSLRFGTLDTAQWREVAEEIAQHPTHLANLLAGHLHRDIDDVFGRVRQRLVPAEIDDVQASCNCATETPWCKHVCCLAQLLAERLDADPSLMFLLRGLSFEDFLERLRSQRALEASVTGVAPVFIHRPPRGIEEPPTPLDAEVERFWSAGAELEQVDISPRPPRVHHPMLRRLGSSPFDGARFPLVGLLATCYDLISERWGEGAELTPPNEPASDSASDRQADSPTGVGSG